MGPLTLLKRLLLAEEVVMETLTLRLDGVTTVATLTRVQHKSRAAYWVLTWLPDAPQALRTQGARVFGSTEAALVWLQGQGESGASLWRDGELVCPARQPT